MNHQASETNGVAKDLGASVHVSLVHSSLHTTEYNDALEGALSDPFGDEFEIPVTEESVSNPCGGGCKEIKIREGARAENVAGRRLSGMEAHLLSLVAPIVSPRWLNDAVAYPNWPSNSRLVDYFAAHHVGPIFTASSAVQLLQNPLRSRNGVGVFEDEIATQYTYTMPTCSCSDCCEQVDLQRQMDSCNTQLAHGARGKYENKPASSRQTSASETPFKCVGIGSYVGPNVLTPRDDSWPARAGLFGYPDRLSFSSESDRTITPSQFCDFDSTVSGTDAPTSKLSFARVPISPPQSRSYLPSARVIKEYDRLQVIAQAWDQKTVTWPHRVYREPSRESEEINVSGFGGQAQSAVTQANVQVITQPTRERSINEREGSRWVLRLFNKLFRNRI